MAMRTMSQALAEADEREQMMWTPRRRTNIASGEDSWACPFDVDAEEAWAWHEYEVGILESEACFV